MKFAKLFFGIIFVALMIGASAAPANYKIPDFTCGYDGQMVSGFRDGKPVCSTPAGFIVPNLKCPDAQNWNPQVLVGIKDGQPVCKGLYLDYDQNIMGNLYSSDSEIHISLHFIQPAQPQNR